MIRNFLLASALFAFSVTESHANQKCGTYEQIFVTLSDEYGEKLYSTGVSENEKLLTFWGNESTGSWTLVEFNMELDTGCIVSEGYGFRNWAETLGQKI